MYVDKEERTLIEQHIESVTCMDLPLDWDNLYDADVRAQGVHTESISDALVICLNTLGMVDIEYISSITGADYKTVICALKGSIYQNPDTWGECFFMGWETAEEYLSGNLMNKWKVAKEANEYYSGYFEDNVKAIEKVIPAPVATKDIYVTLGSPWVPTDVIDDFISYLLGEGDRRKKYSIYRDFSFCRVVHDEITGTWEIPNKSYYKYEWGVTNVFGTEKIGALHIIERTLNMKTVSVTEEVLAPDGKSTRRVINRPETIAAIEKQKLIIREFRDWVWKDEERKKRLEKIFEEKYSCVRRRNFDGSFLEFPDMSDNIQLYSYQKNAVARILFSPNTLLAHDVGAGKTYVMIAAGQELRRMGLSKKNMYVVPNNIVGQWRDIYLSMYPNANLLCVEPKMFRPDKRQNVIESIRDDEFDAIIIAYSCFEQIPLSKDFYIEDLREQLKYINDTIARKGRTTSKLIRKKETLTKKLGELSVCPDETKDMVCFDKLGITRLFVDEAHNFKNIPIETKTNNVLGISSAGSKKCKDMLDKVHLIQKNNDGKGIVFATGTPITNSITDAYVMQQYLQSGELQLLDLQSFDSWIGMFAERVTEFEIDVDTSQYRLATRFAKFHNLPELTALFSSFADFHEMDESAGIPEFEGYNDALISKTDDFAKYLEIISERADAVRNGHVDRKEDNMLKITTDGRKAALDIRLVNPDSKFTYESKVARCAENVADIYYKSTDIRGTQVVFCDTSTPKDGFNLYTELKERLMLLGVPNEQVAFIHDANSETDRKKLFEKLRKGDIRILLGSTFKLGIGVNIQDKLIAMHHMDVPWRPADMTQREGRILRQGNTNKVVEIYRYITEGSFDAYSWQLLETKQRFISGLLSGSLTERSGSDIEDTVLDYAEIKALAVGNPLIKKRVEVANELTRYILLQRKAVEKRIAMEKELLELPGRINRQEELINKCNKDLELYLSDCRKNPPPTDSNQKKEEAEYRKNVREQIKEALNEHVLETKEKFLMFYRRFSIVLPANMMKEKPYIWLCKHGRYYVELGDAEVGNLVRIDNFMENLPQHLEKLRFHYNEMVDRQAKIQEELSKEESYQEEIEDFKNQLIQIDKKLGVTKNE